MKMHSRLPLARIFHSQTNERTVHQPGWDWHSVWSPGFSRQRVINGSDSEHFEGSGYGASYRLKPGLHTLSSRLPMKYAGWPRLGDLACKLAQLCENETGMYGQGRGALAKSGNLPRITENSESGHEFAVIGRTASRKIRRVDRFEQKKIEFAWPAH
jgi:hypothetical protein